MINGHPRQYVADLIDVKQAYVHNLELTTKREIRKLDEYIKIISKHYGMPEVYFRECAIDNVNDLLHVPELDFWVWDGTMTYEEAKQLEQKLPLII